jgi:L(+)-tartrate dehydratase beta subunit
MAEVHLTTPVSDADIASLTLGDVVYLSGVLYTAREGVYRKVVDEGHGLPEAVRTLTNVNFHCSPAASVRPDGTYAVEAVTATASFRFGKSMSRWFERSGTKVVVGKAGLTELAYREWFVPHGAVYLTTVGYGLGAAYGRCIKRVRDVHWLRELGIAQALWVLEVERLGPFLVEGDRPTARSTCGSARCTPGFRPTRWAASARPPPAPTRWSSRRSRRARRSRSPSRAVVSEEFTRM